MGVNRRLSPTKPIKCEQLPEVFQREQWAWADFHPPTPSQRSDGQRSPEPGNGNPIDSVIKLFIPIARYIYFAKRTLHLYCIMQYMSFFSAKSEILYNIY